MELIRKCPICNSLKGKLLDTVNFPDEDMNCLPKHYDIVACDDCGFAFANMDADQGMYDQYYKNLNIYSEAETLRNNNTNFDNKYFNNIYNIIRNYISDSSAIIDIGCGGGELLDFLNYKSHNNIYGLDPSLKSVESLTARGYNGIVGSIFSEVKEEYKSYFELLISTAVVEHIYDLNEYVTTLSKYVKKDGYVFITAPAVEGFEKYIISKPNYFNQEHINYFSVNSLTNLFAKHGFIRVNENCIDYDEEEQILYLLFKYDEDSNYTINKDDVSERSISNYLNAIAENEKILCDKIEKVLKDNSSVVIWGTGQYAKMIALKFPELMEKILYYVDNNTVKHGNYICGKEIKAPITLCNDSSDITVCICSMKNASDICDFAHSIGISNNIVIL